MATREENSKAAIAEGLERIRQQEEYDQKKKQQDDAAHDSQMLAIYENNLKMMSTVHRNLYSERMAINEKINKGMSNFRTQMTSALCFIMSSEIVDKMTELEMVDTIKKYMEDPSNGDFYRDDEVTSLKLWTPNGLRQRDSLLKAAHDLLDKALPILSRLGFMFSEIKKPVSTDLKLQVHGLLSPYTMLIATSPFGVEGAHDTTDLFTHLHQSTNRSPRPGVLWEVDIVKDEKYKALSASLKDTLQRVELAIADYEHFAGEYATDKPDDPDHRELHKVYTNIKTHMLVKMQHLLTFVGKDSLKFDKFLTQLERRMRGRQRLMDHILSLSELLDTSRERVKEIEIRMEELKAEMAETAEEKTAIVNKHA